MEKTKIMFINPPQSVDNKFKVNNLKFPLGFLYMADYLEKNGFRGLPANSPLRGEPQLFNVIWFCSVCHAIPDPDQFPANEWNKIVDRMNSYRNKQGREEMSNADRKEVINFLSKKRH